MRAILALTSATFQNLTRYRTEYFASFLGPLFWVIPAYLLTRFANNLGMTYDFLKSTGINLDLAVIYFFAGAVYWNYVEGVWGLSIGLRANMRTGTLEGLWATPASRFAFIVSWSIGRLFAVTVHSILSFILLIALTLVNLNQIRLENAIFAVVVLMFSILAAYGFAFVLVGITLIFKDAESIISILGNAAPLLGGVIFPVALLPTPLRALSYLFPFTYGVDAFRGVLFGSKTILPLEYQLPLIVLMGLLFIALGWIAFMRLENKSRVYGLEGF
jgi:ABC-2 type transport system permease protein